MGVVITTYKMRGSADRDAANMIIAAFTDFGFITPPDKIKKDKKEKSHRKKSRIRYDSTRTKKNKHRSKRPRDTKLDVCWTCGKTGHKASECRSGAKNNKINLLGMDEETRGKLLAILDSDKSQSGKDCTYTEAFYTCDNTPHMRVLSDHSKEALFDVIQHINDDEARNRFIIELKNILLNTGKLKPRPIIELFSMKQLMNCSENHSEPSISDLRHEISSLKEEVRSIKSQLCIVETDILTNQVPKRTTYQDIESDQDSSNNDNIKDGPPETNHPVEPFVTNTGNDTSTSTTPGVTLPKLLCPPQPKLINLKPTKPLAKEASSSSVQTKASYAMKIPESLAQAVKPELIKTIPSKPTPKEESFEFIISQVLPLKALNKEYENVDIGTLIKHCYTDFNYVDTDNPLKTRRFYEVIIIDTGSIEIEHSRDYIQYSGFEEFETKEEITTLPVHIKICKYYIQKRISYIITCNFSKSNVDRIQYLCKQIQVKGWIPKQPNAKVQEKARSSSKKLSKATLK
ncbi:hypothetical protein H5410_056460 [Solanum commersonii]|uniref:CCHC-type domain-containing protein n=1 Tax=Solanum commersonii TaxID=4109 RepID=A0A9J5WN54_SOLCO|nr:hypothetical protein H5410_056460 [Solanum commersonii]